MLGEPLAEVRGARVSHATDWTCRACGFLLGRVRDGVLYPVVTVERIDSRGVAQLRCPRCETARHWFPAGVAAAVAGDRRPADRPG